MYGFEEDVHAALPFCEIHIFDHTVKNPTPPKFATFHSIGLGPSDGGMFLTLESLQARLGHTGSAIEIMKIDCDGCEYETLFSAMPTWTSVRQVLMEIHWQGASSAFDLHSFFNSLFRHDWAIFSKEPNYQWAGGNAIEFGFLKIDWNGMELQREADTKWCIGGWKAVSTNKNPATDYDLMMCLGWGVRE